MKKGIRIIFIVIICIISEYGLTQNENTQVQIPLNFGFPKSVLPELNERDAKAAIKVWTEDVIETKQYNYKTGFFIYQDVNTLIQALIEGQINIAPLPPIDYIEQSKIFTLYPAVCAKITESVLDRFVLLVRKDSQFTRIQDLENRSLLLKQDSPQSVLDTWLEVMLNESGLPRSDRFFSKIVRKERENQLIFPLLLKQADCCIMAMSAFHTMSELNPQLNIQLIHLVTSDSLLASNIFIYTEQLDKTVRNDVTTFALNWEKSKATEQIQTIFRFNELVPYKDKYMENIRSLLERYNRIQ
ncbi:PhnD/SsuA/transferrin family substrate-binding protein [bacterium]|nr:PhnD/SsuA/transferrin family substrate-binding protein [candidate division CSSED10-310 bacterium]